jgi:hypothetical protein
MRDRIGHRFAHGCSEQRGRTIRRAPTKAPVHVIHYELRQLGDLMRKRTKDVDATYLRAAAFATYVDCARLRYQRLWRPGEAQHRSVVEHVLREARIQA